MSLPPNMLKNMKVNPNVKAEKNQLDSDGLSQAYKKKKVILGQLEEINEEIKQRYFDDAKANGVEPAYIKTPDLVEIISTVLIKNCTISKAFKDRENNASLCKGWAKRTIKRKPDRNYINNAFDNLAANEKNIIQLMKKYKQFDIKSIIKADTYREALNCLKRQLTVTKQLNSKDIENANLKAQIKILSGSNWRVKALSLKQQKMTFIKIASLIGKDRNTVAKFLNQTAIKAQW